MKQDLLKGLTEEQIKKASQCKNTDELLALAKKEGYSLSEEQLAAVSGGCLLESTPTFTCPKCGSTEVWGHDMGNYWDCICSKCKHHWYD